MSDAIMEAYGYDSAYLATCKAGAEFSTLVGMDDQPKWTITFYQPDSDGGYKQYSMLTAVVDPKTGEVIDASEAGYETPAQRVAMMPISPEGEALYVQGFGDAFIRNEDAQ